jgi:splicing factor 3B subunit 5
MTKFEWQLNQHRDTYASYLGHYDMLSYFAVAQNDSIGRVRYQMLEVFSLIYCLLRITKPLYFQKMLQPIGPPPPRTDAGET